MRPSQPAAVAGHAPSAGLRRTRGEGQRHGCVGRADDDPGQAYEGSSLKEIQAAPVSAPAGVTDKDGELLKEAFGITTVRDLGSNKYFAAAGVLVTLAGHAD